MNWINVKKELPSKELCLKNPEFLCLINGFHRILEYIPLSEKYRKERKKYLSKAEFARYYSWYDNYGADDYVNTVTHWMILPELPKEQES